MKAIVQDRYGSSDVLKFQDIPVPTAKPGEVLLEVRAAGVDASVWHLMTGLPYLVRLGFGLTRPRKPVLGQDVAGIVAAAGPDVTEFKPGDEVFGTCQGAFAEFAVARPDKLTRKPANLTFEQVAAIPISAFTALEALRDKGEVQTGQRVLVIGAGGGVGTYAVQLARVFGAEVTGVCSTSKVDLVRNLGAVEVIDYTREDFTAGEYDVILDIAGNRPLNHTRKALSGNGTLVIVGGENGGRLFGGTERLLRAALMSPFVSHRLRGMFSFGSKKDLEVLRDLAEAGKIAPVIDRAYPLYEVPEAISYASAGRARGKVVITI